MQKPPTQLKVRFGPAGVHLFRRATGLNILLDECPVPRAHWSRAPRNVSISLTNACDLSCPYCFAPKHAASIDLSLLTRWLAELDENGCLGVGFGGGEPTLYPHLAKVCQFASRQTMLAVTLTTHAHRFDEAMAESLKGAVHFVRVSMDGVGATYETLRGRSFSAFCARLAIVRRVAPFGLNYLVNRATLAGLDEAVTIAAEYGASEVLLLLEQPVRGFGGADMSVAEALRRWIESYRGSLALRLSELDAPLFPVCDPCGAEAGIRAYAHIDAEGILRERSFSATGTPIGSRGVIAAIEDLVQRQKEPKHEGLAKPSI